MFENSLIDDKRHRSMRNGNKAFIRFVNKTNRKVSIIWLDFEGRKIPYGTLSENEEFMDINTFENHPWVFEDADNGDRLVADKSAVFYPLSWKTEVSRLPSQFIYAQPLRRIICISFPLYSLKERALQIVRDCLIEPEDCFSLDLPLSLITDIFNLVDRKSNIVVRVRS